MEFLMSEMITIPKADFRELVIVAQNLREAVERLATERNELKKNLTITKAQLEAAEEQIDAINDEMKVRGSR
jgi:prefoldin subunit 5